MSTPENKPPLTYFGVEVTRRCNLRCPHCFTDAGGKAHPGPDTDTLANLLIQLAQAGAETVAFSGGEPLLRNDLEQIMERGREHGIQRYTLVTNGYFAEPQRVRSLRQAGLVGVQVSVDGVDAHGHCAVRQCSPVDYYRALRAIRLYQDIGIVVDVACIISPVNVPRAGEMLLLCEALRVRSLRYCTFVPTGRGVDDEISQRFTVEPAQLDLFLEFLRSVRAEPDVPLGVLIDHGIGPWHASGEFRCEAGKTVVYITAEGDLYPCPGTIFEPFKIGNVYQTPITELLASPKMDEVRAISKAEIAEPCRSCSNTKCTGGCRGASYAIYDDVYGAPFYCNVLRRTPLGPVTE